MALEREIAMAPGVRSYLFRVTCAGLAASIVGMSLPWAVMKVVGSAFFGCIAVTMAAILAVVWMSPPPGKPAWARAR